MAQLRSDPFARPSANRAPPERPERGRLAGGTLLFVLLFAALVILVLSLLGHASVEHMRRTLTSAVLPVSETLAVPAHRLRRLWRRLASDTDTQAELERLRSENQVLRQWRWRARRLEDDNSMLRRQLAVAADLPSGFVTGRLVTDGRGPFFRSALINVGREDGVERGLAVVVSHGLIGRTVEVGDHAARVLYLSDHNSRVPVFVGKGRIRAIAVGDNSDRLRLLFAPQGETIAEGDAVYTSGKGGVFPKGLEIGTVVRLGTHWAVAPAAEPGAAEYASVLIYSKPRLTPGTLAAPDPASVAAPENATGDDAPESATGDNEPNRGPPRVERPRDSDRSASLAKARQRQAAPAVSIIEKSRRYTTAGASTPRKRAVKRHPVPQSHLGSHKERQGQADMLERGELPDPTGLAIGCLRSLLLFVLAVVATLPWGAGEAASSGLAMTLLGIAASMAMLIGAIGIYGVISYLVNQRIPEIGVRIALGASGRNVRRLVIRRGLVLTAIGMAVGLAGSFLVGRALQGLLYEVAATDPLTYAAVIVLVATVALAASWIPALRASRISPVRALRQSA